MTEHQRAMTAWLDAPEQWKRDLAAARLKLPFRPDPVPNPGPPAPPPGPLAPALESSLVGRPWESLAWLRRWAAAGPDPAADVARYTDPRPPEPGPEPGPVAVWLHAAILGSWAPILRELFSLLERTGVAAAAGSVNVGVVGPEADLSWFPPWARVVKRDGAIGLGENSTLQALWDWSKSAPRTKVLYLHTKGSSHGDSPNVRAWRDYLAWGCVLRWRECAAALDDHDAAGVEFQQAITSDFEARWRTTYDPDRAGFVGNFWWADSAYLASLPPGRVILDRDRWNAEWDFVGAGKPRVKCLHDARFNFYDGYYPRSAYDPAARSRSECIKEARACPDRETNGSCQTARCRRGKGREGVVYLSDCVSCIKEGPTP